MTSMSSTLRNYTDLEEVSATLDKLKENALKNIRSINDIGDYSRKRKCNKSNKHAIETNGGNNYNVNKKKVLLTENNILNDCKHQSVDAYDLFKNDASNKSNNLNDVFEYDFVNMDECLYNDYQQLHEDSYTYAKQSEGSCFDQTKNVHEENNGFRNTVQMDVHQESHVEHDVYYLDTKSTNKLNNVNEIYIHEDFRDPSEQLFEFMHSEQLDYDEDHHLSSAQSDYSIGEKLFEYNDKEPLNSFDGVANEDESHDLKYESSMYTCIPTKNIGCIENHSNDSSDKESCYSPLDREPSEDDNNSIKISYSHMHNDINNYDVYDENSNLIKSLDMRGSSLDNDFCSAGEDSNINENNSSRKNHEVNSNSNIIHEVNDILNDDHVHKLKIENYHQRIKKCADDEKCKELQILNKLYSKARSSPKVDECNHKSFANCERSNLSNDDEHIQTFNKIGNKFIRKRFEDFKDRRRMNDHMPFRVQKFEPQGFRKGFNHSRKPHQKMFLRRPNFNERRYNMPHLRYGNEFHDFRNSRLKERFSDRTKFLYKNNPKDDYKNAIQQTPLSLCKGKPHSNHLRNRLKRSLSPSSNEDDTPSHRNSNLLDTKRSLSPNISDCRHRRFKPGSSGLGGYSPRRRRPDATKKTPSPPLRSPDRKKPRAWDMAPPGIDSKVVAAIAAAHTAQRAVSKQVSTLSSISSLVSMNIINATNNLDVTSNPALSSMMPSILQQVNQPLSAVTLTQATRSIRRLYVGNVPPTVSDGELMEFMNAAMLSANANHIPRTKPCINCMVNIEKAYAFAEFITPEDATTALGFDGVTLHGTILKIRRPKDFIAPEHGGCPIAQPMINLVANIVLDSPQKIFIGGLSSLLTPDKVKEIVTAFGQLKSFHWKTMNEKDSCVAFLEYLDPVVTYKACIGLNGMHLGGQVLTVMQATPNAKYEVFSNNPPFYDIPQEALSMLETPTNILKLYNLISDEEVCKMQDDEVKELMEDVRFECRRFGNIRSMQLVKPPTIQPKLTSIVCHTTNMEGEKDTQLVEPSKESSIIENEKNDSILETIKDVYINDESNENGSTLETIRETYGNDESRENESTLKTIKETYGIREKSPSPSNAPIECEELQNNEDSHNIQDSNKEQVNDIASVSPTTDCEHELNNQLQDISIQPIISLTSPIPNTNNTCGTTLPRSLELEPLKIGHIYIEYSRIESACQAIHALHGRYFGQLKVEAMYVSPRLYYKYFGKGSCMQNHQEKQSLSLSVRAHLTTNTKD